MAGSSDSSGNWLMTYADFITLMMIFFIVLYTFTPGVEKNKFEAIIGAFQGKRGVLDFDSVFSDEMLDVDLQRAKNWDQLYQYIQQEGLDEQVQIDLVPDGLRIVLGESVTFEIYSAKLLDESKTILKKVADNLENYTLEDLKEIDIQGHTDNLPIRGGGRRYQTNWELGAARATSVLDFFVDNSSIRPEFLKASTYGQYHPRAENATEQGRQKNRRVEIYIRYKDTAKEKITADVSEHTNINPSKVKSKETTDGS